MADSSPNSLFPFCEPFAGYLSDHLRDQWWRHSFSKRRPHYLNTLKENSVFHLNRQILPTQVSHLLRRRIHQHFWTTVASNYKKSKFVWHAQIHHVIFEFIRELTLCVDSASSNAAQHSAITSTWWVTPNEIETKNNENWFQWPAFIVIDRKYTRFSFCSIHQLHRDALTINNNND